MIKRLNNAKRQTNYLVCNIEVPGTYELSEDEKIACYIAIGYGETQSYYVCSR